MDDEINKLIDLAADEYVSLDDKLKENGLTFEKAETELKEFQEKYNYLISRHNIKNDDLPTLCSDISDKIKNNADDPELKYLYFCVITDSGLLNGSEQTGEQKIENYLKQRRKIAELTDFFRSEMENERKLEEIKNYLKKPVRGKYVECSEEKEDIFYLSIQQIFLYGASKEPIYKDNLDALITYINSDKILKKIKPYLIFAVVSRRTGMFRKREHFMPNLKAMLEYQVYHIEKDNGKNFNQYQSNIEFYYGLKEYYSDETDVDIELCDHCFAYLSPLSEWYYENCECNEEIPMQRRRKLLCEMNSMFPMILSFEEYGKLSRAEIEKYSQIERNIINDMLETGMLIK